MAGDFVAVLTGDIAGSRRLSRRVRTELPAALRGIASTARERFAKAVCHPIDVFRGDSWQLLVREPSRSLRIALFMRANLRAAFEETRVDTRVAIGVGTVDFVPETDISGGDGEAFRLSGRALDEMGRGFRMAVALSPGFPKSTNRLLDAVAKLIDVQAASWTQRQAFAVGKALLGLTQEEIGEAWMEHPISQQTVAQHLASAGWNAIDYALSVTEPILESH